MGDVPINRASLSNKIRKINCNYSEQVSMNLQCGLTVLIIETKKRNECEVLYYKNKLSVCSETLILFF